MAYGSERPWEFQRGSSTWSPRFGEKHEKEPVLWETGALLCKAPKVGKTRCILETQKAGVWWAGGRAREGDRLDTEAVSQHLLSSPSSFPLQEAVAQLQGSSLP